MLKSILAAAGAVPCLRKPMEADELFTELEMAFRSAPKMELTDSNYEKYSQ